LLAIHNDQKLREQEPAPPLTIKGGNIHGMISMTRADLRYWGTGNGDMRATKEVAKQKIIAARDLIKCYPLTPSLATE